MEELLLDLLEEEWMSEYFEEEVQPNVGWWTRPFWAGRYL